MQYRRVIGLAAPLLMQAAVAHATIDPITLQVMAVMNRWVALIMIVVGLVGAGIVYLMERDFRHAFITLSALAVGGVLCSQFQSLVTFFFPG
jgi:hypothetical protein